MKAYVFDELGRPGEIRDVPVPEPADGQVRIRVVAAGLNPFDQFVAQGSMQGQMEHRFPFVPGADASGTVDALGAGVSGFEIGEDVFGSVGKMVQGEGTFAELATMSAGTLARKPASIEHPEAAAIPVAGATALTMVDAASVSAGDVVLALGGTGGVGSYLVQLAARRGGRVIAVSGGRNADYARQLGAAETVDYARDDLVDAVRAVARDGIDVLAEMHRGEEGSRLAPLIRSDGRFVSAVGGADEKGLTARGVQALNIGGRVATEPLETLAGMLERGEIRSPEIRSFPLEEAAAAFDAIATGHTRGKIVVVPS
jgi:NADPH2:quinone reductase